ncbi:hypothetical protein QOZ80_2BG0193290 [Eleusine coracana subsp. coracana]|nr:hypothetical protein QOZ80_2BG0193290 [Eleusine coracana subsp. coracana]
MIWTFFFLAIIASSVALLWYMYDDTTPPEYTVVITGVSGLDRPAVPDTKQGGVLINPAFNLTIGVASKSKMHGACIDPHTIVKVSYSYLQLPLAAGNVPSVCVSPLESSDLRRVVAKGRNVAVPGFLFDTLAEEMRSGEALFEVKLNAYDGKWDDWTNVLTRWVVVGDAAARPGPAVHAAVG